MLTPRERRVLAAMGRRLAAEDPGFVARLRWPAREPARPAPPAALLTVALVAMLACAVLLLPMAALACGGLAVAMLGREGLRYAQLLRYRT